MRRSLELADLINVPNDDERRYVEDRLGLRGKCRVFPFGLSASRRQSLCAAMRPAAERLAEKTIAFVGVWSPRKGAKDWGAVIRRVRTEIPDARFLFLGTGYGADVVRRDLALESGDGIEVVPTFAGGELPRLLARATAGAFPSYIEGFGFGLLEMLAAGLPSVAYDVPGPRSMLGDSDMSLLAKAGDVDAMGARLVALLETSPSEYVAFAEKSLRIAERYDWSEIAAQTVTAYRQGLEGVVGRCGRPGTR